MIRRPPRSTLFPSTTLFRSHREGPLPHGASPRAHAAGHALERDAALRIQLKHAYVHRRPAVRRHLERARLAGVRARHVGAHDAGLEGGSDHRRAGGQSGARGRRGDGVHRADVDAVAAAGAGREERDLRRGARWPEPAARRHALLRQRGRPAQQPAHGLPQEPAAIRDAQKLGSRLNCHRSASVPSPGRKSAARSQRFTTSGASRRMVQPRSRTRGRTTRPAPPSYSVVYHLPGGDAGTARGSTTPPSAKTSTATSRKIPASRRNTERVSSTLRAAAQRPARSLRKPRRLAFPGAWYWTSGRTNRAPRLRSKGFVKVS